LECENTLHFEEPIFGLRDLPVFGLSDAHEMLYIHTIPVMAEMVQRVSVWALVSS